VSIDRDYEFKTLTVNCDGNRCFETLEFDDVEIDWESVLDVMRVQGWRIVKENGDWSHYCPTCERKRQALIKAQQKLFNNELGKYKE
jgi:thiol-disulfide isomerase/thioredoxin